MSVVRLDQDACRGCTRQCRRVPGSPDPLVEERRERVSEWGRVEVEVDDDLTRVLLEQSDAMGRDTGLGTGVGEAVEGRLPGRVVGDLRVRCAGLRSWLERGLRGRGRTSQVVGVLARRCRAYADRVSRDTFLVGVHRSLACVDDDRTLRRAVVEQVRRTVPFDAFAWLLTDPDTTVGTAPLADVPCLDQLARLVALRYTSGTSLDRRRSGSSLSPGATRIGAGAVPRGAMGRTTSCRSCSPTGSGGGGSSTCGGRVDEFEAQDFELLGLLGRAGDRSASRVTCGHASSCPTG